MMISFKNEETAIRLYDNGWRNEDVDEVRDSYEVSDEEWSAIKEKLIELDEDPNFCHIDCDSCPFVRWVYRGRYDDPYPVCGRA